MDPRRVLVVTDVDLSGWALRQALTAAGFVVLTAGDADAARTVVEASEAFDVVVVSLTLGTGPVTHLLDDVARLWPGASAVVLAAGPGPSVVNTIAEHELLEKPFSVDDVVSFAQRATGAEVTPARPRVARAGGFDSVARGAKSLRRGSVPLDPGAEEQV